MWASGAGDRNNNGKEKRWNLPTLETRLRGLKAVLHKYNNNYKGPVEKTKCATAVRASVRGVFFCG